MCIKAFFGAVLTLACCCAPAADRFQISLGTLESGDWQLQDITLSVDWSATGHSIMHVNASTLVIGTHQIENLNLSCPAFELLTNQVACQNGKLGFHHDAVKAASIPASLTLPFFNPRVVHCSTPATARRWQAEPGNSVLPVTIGWQLDSQVTNISLQDLTALLEEASVVTGPFERQGRMSGQVKLHGNNRWT